jgi:hypothetical protein
MCSRFGPISDVFRFSPVTGVERLDLIFVAFAGSNKDRLTQVPHATSRDWP